MFPLSCPFLCRVLHGRAGGAAGGELSRSVDRTPAQKSGHERRVLQVPHAAQERHRQQAGAPLLQESAEMRQVLKQQRRTCARCRGRCSGICVHLHHILKTALCVTYWSVTGPPSAQEIVHFLNYYLNV